MSYRIFIDANVPTYAAGRDHALKDPCIQVMRLAATQPGVFFTDAEVVQELLHRYMALRMWPQAKDIVQRFILTMRDSVESIHLADVEGAMAVAGRHPGLSARDVLHLAVMARNRASHIVTADRDFDVVPDVVRLDPADHATWRAQIENA
jgi:predicted nucleic acid-binding protein